MINKVFNKMQIGIMCLFTSNLNLKIHGREIARLLKANQRTVKLGLDELEKKKILKMEIKGKNKEFNLNKENLLTKELIIMTEEYKSINLLNNNFEIYSIIKDLKEIFEDIILIYGSFAKGYAIKSSDLDLLLIGKKRKLEDIKNKYSRKIHIMFLTKNQFVKGIKNKQNFIMEILNNHIICQNTEKLINWRFKYE